MPDTPPLLHRWEHKYSILSTVAFPHKKILFAGTQDSKILCFDLTTYSLIKTINVQTQVSLNEQDNTKASVLCLSKSKNEKFLFAGGSDSLIRIWKIHVIENMGNKNLYLDKTKDIAIEYVEESETKKDNAESTNTEYFVPGKSVTTIIEATEIATIYSTLDIGDIFSLIYLDESQTIIFGTQRAALLYVSDIFNAARSSKRYELLPHNRYDKFFDSMGPAGHLLPRQPRSSFSSISSAENQTIPQLRSESPGPGSRLSSPDSYVATGQEHFIIEVPSTNIISYAHNGFIYSLFKYENSLMENNQEHVISGAGDGVSKIWKLNPETLELEFQFQLPVSNSAAQSGDLDEDSSDDECEDDIIFSQTVQFPFLYCGMNEGNVKIWDLNTKQLISKINCGGSLEDVTSICCWEGCVFAATKNKIVTFKENKVICWVAHKDTILSMSFLRPKCTKCKNIRLISGSADGSLVLWNTDSLLGELLPESHSAGERRVSHSHAHLKDSNLPPNLHTALELTNDHLIDQLKNLIKFQTVSSLTNDTHAILDSHSCAAYLIKLFSKFGAAKTKLIPVASGNKAPIVYAKFYANSLDEKFNAETQTFEAHGKPKNILWYGHYDVVEPGNDWNTDPFTLIAENGYLKGRGVSDNKGPILAALFAVADLFSKQLLKNNIVFLIEGQEESGSNGFINSLQEANINLNQKIDSILLSNSYWLDECTPCMNYGLRGVINMRVTITSDEPDRHSGVDGGVYQEPTTDLFQIMSKLIEGPKKVKIPNFYTPLKDISSKEVSHFKDIVERTKINTTVENLVAKWTKPSLSITTMNGGVNTTVIAKTANATASIRIVPEQKLQQVKKDTIEYLNSCFEALESSNHLNISILNEAEPWLGNTESKAYQVLKNEIQEVWGVEPLLVREGGSIPTVGLLEKYFQAPAVQIPAGQSTDNAHLGNEQLRILNLLNLRKVVTKTVNLL